MCEYTFDLFYLPLTLLFQIVAFALIAAASAATSEIPILRQEADVSFDGSYYSAFETGNGIVAEERGVLKNPGVKDAEAEEVVGSVSYPAPDGTPIQLKYIANENGFVAEGAHLPVAPVDTNVPPTPPPIPAAIVRALEWIAAHPQPEEPARRV